MKWLCTLVVVLSAAASSALEDLPWWKTAVFYQVYPRSFKDSDGDGVGDLKGITQVADYFKELGVDAIWLSPINKSPMADFGYDISDFMAIDPIFGTMADFDALVQKLREIDVKLVLDFVPNHSSDEHEWFQKSLNNVTNPEFSDFYVWHDPKIVNGTRQPPNNWVSAFSGSMWEWNDQRQQYYLHQFVKKQPDLNYRNPNVRSNMTAVLNFWLDKGVDGFRMDAVQHMYEDAMFRDDPVISGTGELYNDLEHLYDKNQPETHTMLLSWADVVNNRVKQDNRPRAIFLEVYDTVSTEVSYYGKGNEGLEFPFNFNLLTQGNQSARPVLLKTIIDSWMSAMPTGAVANWVVGNHDQGRVADRYGPEMVDAINLLTGVLPGIKVTYNGEEIGMQNTFVRWDETVDPAGRLLGPYHYLEATRDPQRTPMQWDDSTSAGFSTNGTTWLPVNPNYWWLNVEAQKTVETSHYKVFQALIKARKDLVLQRGDYNVLVPNDDTIIVVRSYNDSSFAFIFNMGSKSYMYTSQNLFAQNGLDFNMTVVVGSINSGYKPGLNLKAGSLSITLRPKAAVLLRSTPSSPTPSSGTRLLTASSLLLLSLFLILKI